MLASGEKTWWWLSKKGNETLNFFKDCHKAGCGSVCVLLSLALRRTELETTSYHVKCHRISMG